MNGIMFLAGSAIWPGTRGWRPAVSSSVGLGEWIQATGIHGSVLFRSRGAERRGCSDKQPCQVRRILRSRKCVLQSQAAPVQPEDTHTYSYTPPGFCVTFQYVSNRTIAQHVAPDCRDCCSDGFTRTVSIEQLTRAPP